MLAQTLTRAQAAPQPNKPYGGTLIWGTCHKPTLINPVLTTYSISAALEQLIFNGLVRINSRGDIEPDLAESWEVSSDGLVYTFYLKKGVRFHDGVECTAYDVKFTYDKIMDTQVNSPFKSPFELVEKFEAIDKYTFRVNLKKPSAPFIYAMVIRIMPKHILENQDLNNAGFNFHPIGTGPFKFKEWAKNNQIILEYNPDYYEGRPYLDRIIVKVYADSRDTWIALMRGEVDFVGFIEREDYEILKKDPSFKTYAFPADYYYILVYNLSDPILADKRVREAIAYGLDRKRMIEKAAFGYGLECNGPFYPGSPAFNPEVRPIEYNPSKAQEFLREAGWKDQDKDGILEKNGEDLEIKILVDARNDISKRIAMVIRQQLLEIGIKIKIILYQDDSMLTEGFLKSNNPQAHLKFSLAGIGHIYIQADWYSKLNKRPDKLWSYKNEEVDRLFELGEITQDKEKRKEIYQSIHKLIYEEQPACFLYFPFFFYAISNNFINTDEYFTLNMPTYTIKNWYFSVQTIKYKSNDEQK